jgi:hypothetical protein
MESSERTEVMFMTEKEHQRIIDWLNKIDPQILDEDIEDQEIRAHRFSIRWNIDHSTRFTISSSAPPPIPPKSNRRPSKVQKSFPKRVKI